MPHTPAVFAIDATEGLFHGITAGQRWNGWACPMFSFEEAKRLTALNNDSEFCGSISYDADKDAFLFRSEDQDEEDPPEVFEAETINGQKYYAIGAFSWCWQDVTDTPAGRFSVDLLRELKEMQRTGLNVPEKAFALACNERVVTEHLDMGVSEAADLLIELSQLP